MNCQEKCSYPSFARASEVARKRMRDDRTVELRVYRCNQCGLYHLTSRPDRYRPERSVSDQ